MIYGADSPIALPVIDLYDSGAMRMYVDAARDQYQQGLKDYETFMSQYGDFTSPFKKDVAWWDNNVMGPVMNKINDYYARGIDPTRNAEARADIQRAVRSIPRTAAAQRKANAARGEAYLKELGKLAAQGKYDADQNNFYLQQMGYPSFEDFSTEDYGTWGLESPVEASSLFDNTKEWFAGMKPGEMTTEQVDAMMGKGYAKPGYTYTGIPESRLREIIEQRIPGWLDTFQGKFFRENARERAELEKAKGLYPDVPTEDLANKMLIDDIVTANRRSLVYPEGKLDKTAEMAIENRYAMQRQAAKDAADRNMAYLNWRLNNSVPGNDGKPKLVAGGKGKKDDKRSHSHVVEMFGQGIATGTGDNVYRDEVDAYPGLTSAYFIKTQKDNLKSNGGSNFMNSNIVWDSPETLSKFIKNAQKSPDGRFKVNSAIADRLYTPWSITSSAYGFKGKTQRAKLKMDPNEEWSISPTGKYKTVLCKDKKLRVFVEMNAYKSKTTSLGKDSDGKEVLDRTVSNIPKRVFWYNTNITSKAADLSPRKYVVDENSRTGSIQIGGNTVMTGLPLVNTNKGIMVDDSRVPVGYFPQEQLNFEFDPKFETELESIDFSIGTDIFKDTPTRTSEYTRIEE